MQSEILLIGNGGHSKAIQSNLKLTKKFVVYDDNQMLNESNFSFDDLISLNICSILTIGSNRLRYEKYTQATKLQFINLIYESSIIENDTQFGLGNVFLNKSFINSNCILGSHCILNSNSIVEHDCIVKDFVHLAPGSIILGGVQIGNGVLVGAGSVVLPGIKIGDWATIGAGSVITKDVKPGEVIYGKY